LKGLTWGEFAKASPRIAQFGQEKMGEKHSLMYLATIRKDGYPRLHPFTPFVGSGHLFAFMAPTSPKGHDVIRRQKYAIHSSVADREGSNGEFAISGMAYLVSDPSLREVAVKTCSYTPQEGQICFEFLVESALRNEYDKDDGLVKWKLGDQG
jgi:hypothetical protein